ncbi:Disks large-associated protein 5 [Trachymyrmex septentrionalis]|uniref:Disks large-associated protein 5 n=1 Tax=Trachymyrmex septentrionalis TaxID=34720 RepID=A0A195FQ03_9HYME|nr:Disks large-associated protein 5 [Trachymyrmex septentrionalis]
MPDFKEQYKNPRPGFGDTNHRRYLRACNYDKSRREARTRTFDKHRNLQNDSTPTNVQHEVTSAIADERMKKLIKWREERNRKKKLEAAIKKPAFKVGVVHHSLCSPIIKSGVKMAKTPNKTENSNYIKKRITRATEKRLLAKAAAQQTVKNSTSVIKHPFKTMTSCTKKSFAPADYCFKPPSGLQKMPLFGLVPMKGTPQEKYPSLQTQTSNITEIFETSTHSKLSLNKQKSSQKLSESIIRDPDELNTIEAIGVSLKEQAENQTDTSDSLHEENFSSSSTDTKISPKITSTSFEKENCDMEDLICFSPYLTRTRGKRNSRIEGQQRLGIGRRSDEIPTKDTVMKNLNICVEEEERTAQYFMLIVNKETDRLKELCKKWLDVGVKKNVPEDAMYEIQQAVGQTNLLINKKFERFRGLVQDCETGKGEMLVTCKDLQGFWDMTYMEVKDCDMRFEKLEQRQNRGWQEEEYTVVKPAVKKRMAIKKRTVSSKPSSLRSLILAARKNMEEGTLNKDIILPQDTRLSEKPSNRKSFTELRDENTNIRHSISRSKSHDLNEKKSTPARRESSTRVSSVQKVQFSDKIKRMKSPFAAMKISKMCKTPEVELDDTVSYVNSDQTPGKSILKKSEELENKETRIKSAHKVNFDDQIFLNNILLNEEIQTKLSLAAALTKVDSPDKIDTLISPPINAEKRLDFEDSDSNDDLNKLEIKIKTGKRNKSKLSVQNTLDTIEHLFNDIPSVSIKELSSDNNEKIVSSRKSLRNRVQHKDTPNRKSVDILFSPSALVNRDDKMATITEIISKDMEDVDLGIKVLRNRTILANNTPKSNRSSKMMTPKKINIDKEENESPVKKLSRKSSLKLLKTNKDEHMTLNTNDIMQIENVTLIGNTSKKRSLRNVAFDETCVACAENKPVLPMTPYSKRRSKTPSRHSLKNRNKSIDTFDEDLISWDTPDKKYRKF